MITESDDQSITMAISGGLEIDSAGWLKNVEIIASPNFEPRPAGCPVSLIVVHNISLPPGEYGGGHVQELFTNCLDPKKHAYFREIEGLKVSAHCLIERTGHMIQFVSFNDRAWHAGESCWQDQDNCNDFSIGIELEGSDDEAFERLQYQQLARLVVALRHQYCNISSDALCGHSDIAPGRKTDPGPYFDWQYLKQLTG